MVEKAHEVRTIIAWFFLYSVFTWFLVHCVFEDKTSFKKSLMWGLWILRKSCTFMDILSLLSSPITLCSGSHDLNKANTLWAWGVDATPWSPQSEWHLSPVTFHTSVAVPDGACLYMPGIWWTSDRLLLEAGLFSYILNV